jgi:hypothetical protein
LGLDATSSEPKPKLIPQGETVAKFFYESVKYDESKNKLLSLFNNVRLHYIDIGNPLSGFLYPALNYAIGAMESNNIRSNKNAEVVINVITELMSEILQILKNKNSCALPNFNIKTIRKLETPPKLFSRASSHFFARQNKWGKNLGGFEKLLLWPEYLKDNLYNLIHSMNKFLCRYTNKNVKKIIYHYIDIYLIPEWDAEVKDFINLENEIKQWNYQNASTTGLLRPCHGKSKGRESQKNKLTKKLVMKLFHLPFVISKLVDIYFMRRFLDKKYITNAVVYSGAVHAVSQI